MMPVLWSLQWLNEMMHLVQCLALHSQKMETSTFLDWYLVGNYYKTFLSPLVLSYTNTLE